MRTRLDNKETTLDCICQSGSEALSNSVRHPIDERSRLIHSDMGGKTWMGVIASE